MYRTVLSIMLLLSVLSHICYATTPPPVVSQELRKLDVPALACPPNTVHSEPFDPNAKMSGINRSDQGYYANASRDYQAFTDNRYAIQGVQIFGIFADSHFQLSTERLQLDDEGHMLNSIRLEVAFWEMGANGLPGEQLYREEVDIVGQRTDALWNAVGEESKGYIYAFKIDLKDKVYLESGFVSVCAVDTGEKHQTSFCTIHDSSRSLQGLISMEQEGSDEKRWFAGGFNYCFLGSTDEPLAQKGVKVKRILSPKSNERGKYAILQVELRNYGLSHVSDATFELYEGERLLFTERIDNMILSGESFKYTFSHRIDCSAPGEHIYRLKNVTPQDALKAPQEITFKTVCNVDAPCASSSSFEGEYKWIKRVSCGKIINETGWSLYSDYRDYKTEIRAGETLTLEIDKEARNGDFVKVWVDWNENGLFDDLGEFIGYVPNSTLQIRIPEHIRAIPGDKCMRIVLSNQDVSPCEVYQYGETEDYTLTVLPNEESPRCGLDVDPLELTMKGDERRTHTIAIANQGKSDLHISAEVEYRLPSFPGIRPVSQSASAPRPTLRVERHSTKTDPPYDPTTKLSLTYAGFYQGDVGADNVYVSFAHYFPGIALGHIYGMQLSSVDVYIAQPARKSFVSVWRGERQYKTGAEIYRQQFTPVAHGWNHIKLTTPVTISNEDLWIGVSLEGCKGIPHLLGLDGGPASTGFGDMISIDRSSYWWSLADLGTNANLLIRGNVTGAPSPCLRWITLDKKKLTIAPNGSGSIEVSVDTRALSSSLYEAAVIIRSDDPLVSYCKIPIYLNLTSPSEITQLKGTGESDFIVVDKCLQLNTDKATSYIALFDMAGALLQVELGGKSLDMRQYEAGIYLAKVVYADGSESSDLIMIQ